MSVRHLIDPKRDAAINAARKAQRMNKLAFHFMLQMSRDEAWGKHPPDFIAKRAFYLAHEYMLLEESELPRDYLEQTELADPM